MDARLNYQNSAVAARFVKYWPSRVPASPTPPAG
jgi:hypothetical protein